MRVLVVTNMYPSANEPQFGSFVKEQVEDLRALGIDMELSFFDGRVSWTRYVEAARTIRGLVKQDRFDLVHAHYGLCGAVALGQRYVPVVTTFHGSDVSGAIRWQTWISRLAARHSRPIFVSKEGARAPGAGGCSGYPGRRRRRPLSACRSHARATHAPLVA
jgi:hypothetical protein